MSIVKAKIDLKNRTWLKNPSKRFKKKKQIEKNVKEEES